MKYFENQFRYRKHNFYSQNQSYLKKYFLTKNPMATPSAM